MTDNELRQQAESGDKCGATPVLPGAAETPTNRKGKGGAPRGNANNFQHGAKSKRRVFPLADLGRKHRNVMNHLKGLRRRLEGVVGTGTGQVGVACEAGIESVLRYQATALILHRLIAKGTDSGELTPSQIVGFLRTACWAARERNIALERLGFRVNGEKPDPWDAVYPDGGDDTEGGAWDAVDASEDQDDPEAKGTTSVASSEAVGDVASNPGEAESDQ